MNATLTTILREEALGKGEFLATNNNSRDICAKNYHDFFSSFFDFY